MLPRNIDLTANRDFSNHNGRFHLRQIIDHLPDVDSLFMSSSDEYALSLYEKIFGKRHYNNEKYIIFNYESKHEAYWKVTCARCGKHLIPWQKSDICPECVQQLNGNKVPWKNYYISNNSPRFNDLFDLR